MFGLIIYAFLAQDLPRKTIKNKAGPPESRVAKDPHPHEASVPSPALRQLYLCRANKQPLYDTVNCLAVMY